MSEMKARTEDVVKKSPLHAIQIERLKKEEEDESWISGEELHTEGSSDEERAKCQLREGDHMKELRKLRKKKTSGAKLPPSQLLATKEECSDTDDGASPATPRRCLNATASGARPKEPPPEEPPISWRPKRGSIKLPNVDPADSARPQLSA